MGHMFTLPFAVHSLNIAQLGFLCIFLSCICHAGHGTAARLLRSFTVVAYAIVVSLSAGSCSLLRYLLVREGIFLHFVLMDKGALSSPGAGCGAEQKPLGGSWREKG